MAPDLSSKFQAIMQQTKTLQASLGIDSNGSNVQGDESVNSIFDKAKAMRANNSEGNTPAENTPAEVYQQAKSILDDILSLISSNPKHSAKANKDVNQNATSINNNDQAAETKANEIASSVRQFTDSIDKNTQNIQQALETIEGLSKDSEELKKLKEDIDTQLKIIEDAKKELNNPENRNDAIKTIQAAAKLINGYVEQLSIAADIQAQIEEQNTIVEANLSEITTNINESANTIAEGAAYIQQCIAKGSNDALKTGQTATEAATNTAVAPPEHAVAATMETGSIFTFGASGAAGAKVEMDASDRGSAGSIGLSGSAKNMASLSASLGKMGGDLTQFAELASAVGKLGEGSLGILNSYTQVVEPLIGSIGTWDIDAINEANAQLYADALALNSQNGANVQEENKDAQGANYGQKEFLDTTNFKKAFGI